jgi:hypothetical protein
VVIVPAGEDSQEAQPMPQNNNHDQQEKKDNEKEEDGTRPKAKKMKTTLLGATPRRMRHSTMPTRSKLLGMRPQSPLAD